MLSSITQEKTFTHANRLTAWPKTTDLSSYQDQVTAAGNPPAIVNIHGSHETINIARHFFFVVQSISIPTKATFWFKSTPNISWWLGWLAGSSRGATLAPVCTFVEVLKSITLCLCWVSPLVWSVRILPRECGDKYHLPTYPSHAVAFFMCWLHTQSKCACINKQIDSRNKTE